MLRCFASPSRTSSSAFPPPPAPSRTSSLPAPSVAPKEGSTQCGRVCGAQEPEQLKSYTVGVAVYSRSSACQWPASPRWWGEAPKGERDGPASEPNVSRPSRAASQQGVPPRQLRLAPAGSRRLSWRTVASWEWQSSNHGVSCLGLTGAGATLTPIPTSLAVSGDHRAHEGD